jgi:hypothetical protein
MRTLSLVLAFGFVLAGASVADPVRSGLPNIGTFAYSGPPISTMPPHVIVAARD